MIFSDEQNEAIRLYLQKRNVFITGPGGTGKSALIKHIYEDAISKGIHVQVCALTGCAAILLGCKAKTVHSWSGINLGNGQIEHIVNRLANNYFYKSSWNHVQLLIIDEVSMMSKKLFELLDAIGKKIRRSKLPFGGIQLLFSGDFYQLPPVGNKDDANTSMFCFESPLWLDTFRSENHIMLKCIFRQSNPEYQEVLNQIREGRLKKKSNELLKTLVGKNIEGLSITKPTKLFPTKYKVDLINTTEMGLLSGEEYTFCTAKLTNLEMSREEKIERYGYTSEQIETELNYIYNNMRTDPILKLKIGAQVMCIINIMSDDNRISLCNGSQGIVVGISSDRYPIVTFNNGITRTMVPFVWKSENIPGIGVSQVPLILAWALTIHKSQGATLDCAEIDVGSGIFECGQTYVALSRVKSMEGLSLTSYDPNKIKINATVQSFYGKLTEDEYERQRLLNV